MNKGGAFVIGAIVGLAAGIFLAPKSGEENLADAKGLVKDVLGQGQDSYTAGAPTYQSATAEQKNDQLQAKIDAARKIIAEQVARNAAEAKQAAEAAAAEAETIEVQ